MTTHHKAPDAPAHDLTHTTVRLAKLGDHVAHVQLVGPLGNPIGLATLRALHTVTERLRHDPEVRVAVLTGSGRQFCFGADLRDAALGELTTTDPAALATEGQALVDAWASLPFPTVVGVQGKAIGAGACLVVASDFRLMADDAVLSFPEVERGMYLSWGILARLQAAFGAAAAKWMALACVPVRAKDLPPLSVQLTPNDDLHEGALALAKSLATLPQAAARLTIQALRELQAPAADPSADADRFARSIQDPSFFEAMQHFMTRPR